MSAVVRERALMLGAAKNMLGILSEPVVDDAGRPLVIILNAGIVHRIGPHRKTVRLARALARSGFRVLRLDLSGLGDSEPRRDTLGFDAAAQADIGEVIDDLVREGIATSFVIAGLCSGADNSFQATKRYDKIVGAVIMDGYAYRTPGYHAVRYARAARSRATWVRLARRVVRTARERMRAIVERDGATPEASSDAVAAYIREFPPKEEVARDLQDMVNRGVSIYWVHTSGMFAYYNHERQFRDAFRGVDFGGRLTLDYFAESNHTFTELRSQKKLEEAVVGWARRTFPPVSS